MSTGSEITEGIATPAGPDPLEALIDEAFVYAFPVYEVARTCHRDLSAAGPDPDLLSNTVLHDRNLCDHRTRWITTPNNDTLYSNAWLDLSAGPVRIEAAAIPPGRYWSIALLDAFTNNFAILGQRLDGTGPVSVTLVGPHQDASGVEGRVIRAPGDDVWLFARWLIDGPADLPNAHAMQDGLSVHPGVAGRSGTTHGPVPTDPLDPENFLGVVNARLARNPPPPADAELLARLAAIGLRPGATDAWRQLEAPVREAWQSRIGAALAAVRKSMRVLCSEVQGWIVRGPEIGDFGTSHALRAAIALGGLAALPPVEAVYASRSLDPQGERLDGRHCYRIRLAPGGLPNDSFWSLSMYEPTPDGRLFFAENPIGRHAIGDRSPGLRREPDGSLQLHLQHEAPSDPALLANWLPTPPGPFVLTLRAYLPRAELQEWRAPLPGITRV